MTEDASNPRRWHTREDSGIRLDKDGRWWHDDELVQHPKIIEVFNRGLSPTDDGRFRLDFGNDYCFVTVEDAAYRVLVLDADETVGVSVRLSDRTAEPLALDTLAVDDEGIVTCRVKNSQAKARFSRDAQFALGHLLEFEKGIAVLRVGNLRLPVPGLNAMAT